MRALHRRRKRSGGPPLGRRSQLCAGPSSGAARSCASQADSVMDSVSRLAFVTRRLPLCSALCTAVFGVTGVGGPKVAGRCGHYHSTTPTRSTATRATTLGDTPTLPRSPMWSMQARPATESYWVLTSYHVPITVTCPPRRPATLRPSLRHRAFPRGGRWRDPTQQDNSCSTVQ